MPRSPFPLMFLHYFIAFIPVKKAIFLFFFSLPIKMFSESLSQRISLTDYLTGHYDPQEHPDHFLLLPKNMANKPTYLRKEVHQKFIRMHHAAKRSGIKLTVVSGLRTFNDQKRIWQKKYNETFKLSHPEGKERIEKIMESSAMPGISRHHWGTEIDLISLNNAFFRQGYGKKVDAWLQANAHHFGFYLVYTPGRTDGYHEERWHYTYLTLSKELLKLFEMAITPNHITGFSGDHLVKELDIISRYGLGVNPKLLR